MDKIALWKNVRVDDWTAELAIIASNVNAFNDRMEQHVILIPTFDVGMGQRFIFRNLTFLGLCLAGEPCERFAQIVGNFIDFLR